MITGGKGMGRGDCSGDVLFCGGGARQRFLLFVYGLGMEMEVI
ncbi:hypothetical protein A2U01_0061874 [Trifolium medium]|uniref:Uncharacterized protein n=1 Tax=Trifolium medium TaxID=97028 RepID=A0A392RVH3_9FABA|nr:hypothetical protein [Trifolium medium]